jgi:hypothetical protein
VRSGWILTLFLTSCVYTPLEAGGGSGDEPLPEPDPDPRPMATCTAAGGRVALCLEFEDARDPMPQQVLDGSGNHADASTQSIEPTRRQQDGIDENAIKLEAIGARLDIPPTPALDISDAVSIELWFRHDFGAPLGGARHWLVDRNDQYFVSIGSDRLIECGYNHDRTIHSNAQVQIDPTRWQHVACTVGPTPDGRDREVRVYLDGDVTDCKTYPDPIAPNPGGTTIGVKTGGTSNDQFFGSLDNVHVYQRALRPADVCAAAGKAPGTCNDRCPGPGPMPGPPL